MSKLQCKQFGILIAFLFLHVAANAQDVSKLQWLKSGGGDFTSISSVMEEAREFELGSDQYGNTYGVFNLYGNASVDTNYYPNNQYTTLNISKWDCQGNLIWTKYPISGSGLWFFAAYVQKSAKIDKDGNIYLIAVFDCGYGPPGVQFFDTTFNVNINTSRYTQWLVKLDSSGNRVWMKSLVPEVTTANINPASIISANTQIQDSVGYILLNVNQIYSCPYLTVPDSNYNMLKFSLKTGNVISIDNINYTNHNIYKTGGLVIRDFDIYNGSYYFSGFVNTDSFSLAGISIFPVDTLVGELGYYGYKWLMKVSANGVGQWMRQWTGYAALGKKSPNFSTIPYRPILFYKNMVFRFGFKNSLPGDTALVEGMPVYPPSWAQYDAPIGVFFGLDTATGQPLYVNQVVSGSSASDVTALNFSGDNMLIGIPQYDKMIINNDTIITPAANNDPYVAVASINMNTGVMESKGAFKCSGPYNRIFHLSKHPNSDDVVFGAVIKDSLYDSYGNGVRGDYNGSGSFAVGKLSLVNNCACTKPKPIVKSIIVNGNTASVSLSTASVADSVLYNWGDGAINKTNNHTYAQLGTYTVCATAYNTCGTADTCFVINLIAGLQDAQINDFALFPNPTSSSFTINSTFGNSFAMQITDAMGKIVYTNPQYFCQQSINMQQYSSGIYFVSLQAKSSRKMIWKVVKE
jgi:Secretion system C-terminal sorting domain